MSDIDAVGGVPVVMKMLLEDLRMKDDQATLKAMEKCTTAKLRVFSICMDPCPQRKRCT